ncbi:hypothetical protein [Roseovarius aestuarii]|uniref:Uncharacterized protein n=1 Tax=Roseovarius aestuarii TaxID=475083 RepID=A0A1X7BYS7_9RHOB|nr:hypothetical protein [Roseovarius aestuarii]SMC14429.1 hypothetical protein ROA7745_04296 [Roseovarius aestuarii]
MTSETDKISEKMKTVKNACDTAPTGLKKDVAMKHYQAAEKASTEDDEVETLKELDAATLALS